MFARFLIVALLCLAASPAAAKAVRVHYEGVFDMVFWDQYNTFQLGETPRGEKFKAEFRIDDAIRPGSGGSEDTWSAYAGAGVTGWFKAGQEQLHFDGSGYAHVFNYPASDEIEHSAYMREGQSLQGYLWFNGHSIGADFLQTSEWWSLTGAEILAAPYLAGYIQAIGMKDGAPVNLLGNLVVTKATVSAVPEPATWAMLIAGFGATGAALRRRRIHPARTAEPPTELAGLSPAR